MAARRERAQCSATDTAVPGAQSAEMALPKRVERAFTFAILLSALRCTVQYVVLPFILPWVGLATGMWICAHSEDLSPRRDPLVGEWDSL